MSGHDLMVVGTLFAGVGVAGYRYAYELARMERRRSLARHLTGDPEPPGWQVWIHRLGAGIATLLGIGMVLLGGVLVVRSLSG